MMERRVEFLSNLISSFVKRLRLNPILPWAIVFIVAALVLPQRGGDNTYARLATMRSITEKQTFTMDDYMDWSDDWSLSPNGHYYSDKAPGSALIGLPIFALADFPILATTAATDHDRHPAPGLYETLFLVFWVQLFPFAVLILLLSEDLLASGTPKRAVQFFAIAAFFGNTAAIYMHPYSGHALAAWLFLACFFSWRKKSMYWAGFFIAAAVLTDYATVMTLPFFLIATLVRDRSAKALGHVLVGTVPLVILWCWYHTSAFGSPFALAAGYANPENQIYDPNLQSTGTNHLVSMVPYPFVVVKLLFGPERGLLFTQAWILFLLPMLLFVRKSRLEAGLLFGALLGVMWLNSSVLVWAAGRAAGPRYICLVFPAFAYLAALVWKELPSWSRFLLWIGLAEALVLRLLVFAANERVPQKNIWGYYADVYQKAFDAALGPLHNYAVPWKLAIALSLFAIGLIATRKNFEFKKGENA